MSTTTYQQLVESKKLLKQNARKRKKRMETQQTIPEVEKVAPPPVVRKSELKDFFGANFIELMKVAPLNSLVRGQIMKHTGQLPALELDTFDKLKDWIEINMDKTKKLDPWAKLQTPSSIIAQERGPSFELMFDVTDLEYGSCHYRNNRKGTWCEVNTLENIRELIEEGLTTAQIIRKIEEWAVEEQEADMEEVEGTVRYSDHELNDNEDTCVDLQDSHERAEELLLDWLQANDPESYNTLRDRG